MERGSPGGTVHHPKMEPGYMVAWICSPSAIIAYRAKGL